MNTGNLQLILKKHPQNIKMIKVWGCDIIVDWADPQEEPDESTMSKVKVLYVRNLTQDISEDKLKESFEQFGKVERVKKIKDYAFVHFEDRDNAVLAMRGLDGKELGCANIEVSILFDVLCFLSISSIFVMGFIELSISFFA